MKFYNRENELAELKGYNACLLKKIHASQL